MNSERSRNENAPRPKCAAPRNWSPVVGPSPLCHGVDKPLAQTRFVQRIASDQVEMPIEHDEPAANEAGNPSQPERPRT